MTHLTQDVRPFEDASVKRLTILSVAFSVLAFSVLSTTAAQPFVAEGGSDRLIENRVAEGGSDRLILNRVSVFDSAVGRLLPVTGAEIGQKRSSVGARRGPPPTHFIAALSA